MTSQIGGSTVRLGTFNEDNAQRQRIDTVDTIKGVIDDSDDSADDEEYTDNLKAQKSEFVQEVIENDKSRKCCTACSVITRYMIVEQTKKQRALKIGIFTVFLVVMVITMLKSVVDCSPIIFVKIGQDQVGAIDFSMTSPNGGNAELDGNVNFYAIDPFHNPFNYTVQPYNQSEPRSYDKGLRRAKLITNQTMDDDPPPEPTWLKNNTIVYDDRV